MLLVRSLEHGMQESSCPISIQCLNAEILRAEGTLWLRQANGPESSGVKEAAQQEAQQEVQPLSLGLGTRTSSAPPASIDRMAMPPAEQPSVGLLQHTPCIFAHRSRFTRP